MPAPLAGIRVIDFGRFIAGPYCAMLLADMGADVIRVDRRQGSEDRYTGPVTDGGEGGAFPLAESQQTQPDARHLKAWIRRDHPPPGQVRRRRGGESPDRVHEQDGTRLRFAARHQARISSWRAFPPSVPTARTRIAPGFDTIAQAMSGAMSLTGFPGDSGALDGPLRRLRNRAAHGVRRDGRAVPSRQHWTKARSSTDLCLATGVTFMQALLAERSVTGIERQQRGNAAFYSAPADVYRTRDGWIVLQVIGAPICSRDGRDWSAARI